MTTKHQIRLIDILENQTDWVSIRQLSELSGIAEPNLRNIMRQKSMQYLDKAILDTGLPHGGRFVRVYKIPCSTQPTHDALALAKQHQGMFGQLFWASDKKIELMA
jgi:hypothetical protein